EPFENVHRNHILDVTIYPAQVKPNVADRAAEVAIGIAQQLDLVGLMCVEMFVVNDDIIVNELAPRPHNSGHLTIDAFTISQFEMQLRAVCGLPMQNGASPCGSAAMANLLGDLWSSGKPDWPAAIASSSHMKLHLYGKRTPLPGRKMGHLTAMSDSAAEAREIVLKARSCLAPSP